MSVVSPQGPGVSSVDIEFDETQYRALSSLAVASIIFGVLSVLALLDWIFGIIPVLGMLLGVWALLRIRANPRDLTGGPLAWCGVALSLLLLVSGWARLTYVYLTEVPEGYQRISYAELQPETPNQLFPPSALKLDGQKVFIKGYVYPGAQQTGIRQFVLVRDNGTCCFGGPEPKLTDMIQVTLQDPLRLNHSTRLHKLAGTLRVQPMDDQSGFDRVIYHLDADHLE